MIVQWTKASAATSIHRQALIRSNEIEMRSARESVCGDVSETSRDTERGQRNTSQVQAVSGGVSFLSGACVCVCCCGCSTGRKGDDAVWKPEHWTDNDEDDGDDVIGALVAAGFW